MEICAIAQATAFFKHQSTPGQAIMYQSIQSGQIKFDELQSQAIELGLQAKNFNLIGAAGTGKTTTMQALIKRLCQAGHVLPIRSSTKHLVEGSPGIVIVGFTNKAVNNIKKKLPLELQSHCMTIHKLIEYQPVFRDTIDDTGNIRTTRVFEPGRNQANPLPHISTIIFEESSMVGVDLYDEVLAALPRPSATQLIFLGDIFQLPPVFGPSILGFKLAELQTVELTTVYRQALLSPIISLATAIRTCNTVEDNQIASSMIAGKLAGTMISDNGEHGKVTAHTWKKRVSKDAALHVLAQAFLPKIIESGDYNPEEDMILCPFNKSLGTIEINKSIADYLGKKRNAIVHEVIARYTRTHWAVGDKVMVDRHEATIVEIKPTIGYGGKAPHKASTTMNRWGIDPMNLETARQKTADQVLAELDRLSGNSESEESKNLASHSITVYIPDLSLERTLSTAGDINAMTFGYCLTVHKSQGSEWNRVFLMLHDSHAIMISRELLYTAVTRAKNELYIICEADDKDKRNSLKRGSERPIIPGVTLKEKIEYFNGKKQQQLATDQ